MKQPQVHKTKEQLIAESQLKQEQDRKGAIIRKTLYPFVVKNSTSVQDAKMFLSVLALVINQKFLNKMMQLKISDLKLEEDLKEGTPQEEKYREFIELFKDTDLRTALDVLEALPKVIDNTIKQEQEVKKLEDLNIPYMNEEAK